MTKTYKLITILGPTATGKTTFAAHFAKEIRAEIISADSRQVYKGMDLGTGKDLDDYLVDGVHIPYHLIDIVDPGYEYNVYEFQRDFLNAYREINKRNIPAIMCGGTGMYLDSVLKGYNMVEVPDNLILREKLQHKDDIVLIQLLKNYQDIHNISDTSDRSRLIRAIEIQEFVKNIPEKDKFPVIESLNFGISFEREIIRKRITSRLEVRLKEGMIKEVETLLSKGMKPEGLMFYGLEYKLVTKFVIGDLSFDEMFKKLNIAIHQFAKRQMTWFRRMEKQGIKINWIDGNIDLKDKVQEAFRIIKNSITGF
jgi:tRNA dimethylallyltransferase